MNRRGFLSSMLALAAAPAIVKAESLMKIYVPKQDLIVEGFGDGDFTVEAWFKPAPNISDGQWHHLTQIRNQGITLDYIDGVLQPSGTIKNQFREFKIEKRATSQVFIHDDSKLEAIDELRVSTIARDFSSISFKP